MADRDSTQSAPLVPPHYELLSHPLVHAPHSPSYVSCLDTLHNAACLLDLFGHLELDDDNDYGGLSTNAAEAFFWLAKMLRIQGEAGKFTTYLKAMQVPMRVSQPHMYDTMASCLGISLHPASFNKGKNLRYKVHPQLFRFMSWMFFRSSGLDSLYWHIYTCIYTKLKETAL